MKKIKKFKLSEGILKLYYFFSVNLEMSNKLKISIGLFFVLFLFNCFLFLMIVF